MARRLVTVAGALAAAALLTLGSPASAVAATGTLVVNGTSYEDPKAGCFDAPDGPGKLDIQNHTDGDVSVFDEAGCGGEPVAVVEAGGDFDGFGGSIKIA